MNLDHLRYFVTTARTEHVGRASRILAISPSAISTAIAMLEEEIGKPLFERRGRSIALNETGRIFRDEAESILEKLSQLPARVRGSSPALKGHFRLAASPFLASSWLAPAVARLQQRFPETRFELHAMATHLAVVSVLEEGFDLALCFSPNPHPELAIERIHEGVLRLAVRRGHPLAKLSPAAAIPKLADYPACLHKAESGVELCERHPMFERFGIEPRIALLFDSDETALSYVASSDAWTLLPDWVIERSAGKVVALAKPRGWAAPDHIAIVTRSDRPGFSLRAELARALRTLPLPRPTHRPKEA